MSNYLYNGVKLPALPEWDKTAYPYAFMTYWSTGEYVLYLMQSPAITWNDTLEWLFITVGENIRFISNDGTDEWIPYTSDSTSTTIFIYKDGAVLDSNIWTNFDVEYNGTLYLAASEPVPVGIAPEIDPFSMTMGWLIGCRIAGQRGQPA